MSSDSTQITTERLILRPPVLHDAESIFGRYANDSEVTRFLGWPRHTEIAETQAFIQFSNEKWELDQIGPYLIVDKLTQEIMGGTGLELDQFGIASTGYVLARDRWGHGFATEALGAMVSLARSKPINTLFALCHPNHGASIRVLEKCGFCFDEKLQEHIEFPNLHAGVKSDALKYVLSTKLASEINLVRKNRG